MAKSKPSKTDTKDKVEKPKGPKVDYTPKNKVVKAKDDTLPPPVIAYYGEGTFTVTEEGAFSSWNEQSRQLCLDAAQEYIEGYTPAARPALYNFAARAALIENAKELGKAEIAYFGGYVTMGSHMKRQRFWKFISYIAAGRIPNDLRLRVHRAGLNAATRAEVMEYVAGLIKAKALDLIKEGANPHMLCRVSYLYTPEQTNKAVNFETAPHDYTPEMKGYKPLADWSTRP